MRKNIFFVFFILLTVLTSCFNSEEESTFDANIDRLSPPEMTSPGNNSMVGTQYPTIKWKTVEYATKYVLWVDNNADFSSPEINGIETTRTSYTVSVTPLAMGNHYVKIQAKNDNSQTDESQTFQFLITFDVKKPTNLRYSNLSTSGMKISWDTPIDTTSLDGYNIYSALTTPIAWIPANKKNAGLITNQSFTITGLNDDTTYYYFVVAVYSGTEATVKSDELIVTTLPILPDVPYSLVASSIYKNKITISWNKPASPTVTSYKVYVSQSTPATTSPQVGTYPIDAGDVDIHLISGLSAGTTYYIAVTSVLNGGPAESSPSNEITVTTLSADMAEAITCLCVFNGALYAGTRNAAGADIYRSTDGTTFDKVNASGGFGNSNNEYINSMVVFNGKLYVGTFNDTQGGEIWRTDGVNFPNHTWEQVASAGIDDVENHGISAMYEYNGLLYVGVRLTINPPHRPTKIFRTDGTGSPHTYDLMYTWQGNLNKICRRIVEFPSTGGPNSPSDYLYFATDKTSNWGELIRCEPTKAPGGGPALIGDWDFVVNDTKVDPSDPDCPNHVGFGSGTNKNEGFTDVAVYNNRLYVGTKNDEQGVQIWRSSNGWDDFTKVVDAGFGVPNNSMIDNFVLYPDSVSPTKIFASVENSATGAELYQSTDGATWIAAETGGYGNSTNISGRAMAVFDNGIDTAIYIGLENASDGATIYKYLP